MTPPRVKYSAVLLSMADALLPEQDGVGSIRNVVCALERGPGERWVGTL